MALGRVYTIDSGLVTVAATAQTCILVGTTTAVQTFNVEAIRIGIHSGAGVSYPSNGSVMCQMLRSTGTAAGGGTATKNPANPGDVACQSAWLSGSTAITGLTATAVEPWGQELPFTAGSSWGEWVTPGAEIQCPISANLALWVTCSSAGTATQFKAQLVIAE
jgi:hypothetical protein